MPLKKTKSQERCGVIYSLAKHGKNNFHLSNAHLHTHHGFNYEYSLNRLLNVQQALAGLGYSLESRNSSSSDTKNAHGFWSFDTENAIREFQADRNMDVTGHLNHHTYNAILLAYEDLLDTDFFHASDDDLGDDQDSEWHLEQARLDVMEAMVGEHSLAAFKSHLD